MLQDMLSFTGHRQRRPQGAVKMRPAVRARREPPRGGQRGAIRPEARASSRHLRVALALGPRAQGAKSHQNTGDSPEDLAQGI